MAQKRVNQKAGRSGERSTTATDEAKKGVVDGAAYHITPTIETNAAWLKGRLAQTQDWHVDGDDLGTTFLATGAVLVAVACRGDRTAETTSRFTRLSPRRAVFSEARPTLNPLA